MKCPRNVDLNQKAFTSLDSRFANKIRVKMCEGRKTSDDVSRVDKIAEIRFWEVRCSLLLEFCN